MSNLFILNETFTNGLNYNLLNVITFSSIVCGILVIISKNPVVSVLFLIGLFLNIAGYLMMLGINFIGLSYLLVYVGAVSILFLFILMLINVRISELVTDNNNSLPLAIMIGTIFNLTLYKLLPNNLSSSEYSFVPHKLGSDKSVSETQILAGDNMTSDLYNVYSTHNDNLSFVSSQI
jgi:NADH-ubiquinone oxidoreductase chain 6